MPELGAQRYDESNFVGSRGPPVGDRPNEMLNRRGLREGSLTPNPLPMRRDCADVVGENHLVVEKVVISALGMQGFHMPALGEKLKMQRALSRGRRVVIRPSGYYVEYQGY